ncbi:UNVERIFIED_CONTAM: hypothetical protein FKN15_027317 [Acipenser sinensis]
MSSLFPVTLCCISLLSLQQQPLALPVRNSLASNRLHGLEENASTTPGTSRQKDSSETVFDPKTERWKQLLISKLQKDHIFKILSKGFTHHNETPNPTTVAEGKQKVARGRRHAHGGLRAHHPQLMRVGCVLGTCQVQNLSHRLWQLNGQSGREVSSPVNPNSPHSYG